MGFLDAISIVRIICGVSTAFTTFRLEYRKLWKGFLGNIPLFIISFWALGFIYLEMEIMQIISEMS